MRKIYNTLYNVPENLLTRKPDPMLTFLMNNSDGMTLMSSALQNSLDPNFVFFAPELSDLEIREFMKRIHGGHLLKDERFEAMYSLKQLSQEMYNNIPPIYFLVSTEYSIDKLEGLMAVSLR